MFGGPSSTRLKDSGEGGMDTSTSTRHILGLADALVSEHTSDVVVAAGLGVLLEGARAEAALVLAPTSEGLRLSARAGLGLNAEVLQDSGTDIGDGALLASCPVPTTWRSEGIEDVATHWLPGGAGVLVLAWGTGQADLEALERSLTTLDACVARAQAEEKLADLAARVGSAQQLANMGDYDWHIASDTNRWSDQLFRIYGHEPQSFQPSYEKFLSLIHPGDRDRVSALHQNAYATGEPFQMIERIVRPDGEVRYLSSNGEVIMDNNSTPVRMRGTCIDITDHVLVAQERERIAARFQGLVNSAPEAILVLDEDQQVVEANQRAYELLGGDPQGHDIHEILPNWPHGGTEGVPAPGLDGRALKLDLVTVVVNPEDNDSEGETLVALYLRDAGSRIEREAVAAHFAEAQLKRRQALEINDNLVQGLVAAVYALDQGQVEISADYLTRTLSAARAMMDDLLEPLGGDGLRPGDLVRTAPAVIGAERRRMAEGQES
jgi:PAS domain S-box-containing protein